MVLFLVQSMEDMSGSVDGRGTGYARWRSERREGMGDIGHRGERTEGRKRTQETEENRFEGEAKGNGCPSSHLSGRGNGISGGKSFRRSLSPTEQMDQ